MADESEDALIMSQSHPEPNPSETPIYGHGDGEHSHPFSPSVTDFPPLLSYNVGYGATGSSALLPEAPSPQTPISADGDGGDSLSFPPLSSTVRYRRTGRPASYHNVPPEGFQDLLTQVMSAARTPQATHQETTNRWNGIEYTDGLLVMIGMPGLDKEDVKVTVEKNILVVKGEVANAAVLNQATRNPFASREETKYYEKIPIVPDLYKLNQLRAKMKYGVLKVFLPKVNVEKTTDVIVVTVE